MLHDRLIGARWLVYLVVAWGVAWAALPRLAEAAPEPPASLADTTISIAIIVGLLVILFLELIGRRVVSRP